MGLEHHKGSIMILEKSSGCQHCWEIANRLICGHGVRELITDSLQFLNPLRTELGAV